MTSNIGGGEDVGNLARTKQFSAGYKQQDRKLTVGSNALQRCHGCNDDRMLLGMMAFGKCWDAIIIATLHVDTGS